MLTFETGLGKACTGDQALATVKADHELRNMKFHKYLRLKHHRQLWLISKVGKAYRVIIHDRIRGYVVVVHVNVEALHRAVVSTWAPACLESHT